MSRRHFIFDVESIGLHGEGFAAGFVVVDDLGGVYGSGRFACDPEEARAVEHSSQSRTDRKWVADNVPEQPLNCSLPTYVRGRLFEEIRRHRFLANSNGADLLVWAECGWPVEARFLAAAYDDDRGVPRDEGPYPLHEIATAMLCAGMDPMATYDRLPNELPKHDPLADARQSARLLLDALRKIEANQ